MFTCVTTSGTQCTHSLLACKGVKHSKEPLGHKISLSDLLITTRVAEVSKENDSFTNYDNGKKLRQSAVVTSEKSVATQGGKKKKTGC